jgi:hypothetical protein
VDAKSAASEKTANRHCTSWPHLPDLQMLLHAALEGSHVVGGRKYVSWEEIPFYEAIVGGNAERGRHRLTFLKRIGEILDKGQV